MARDSNNFYCKGCDSLLPNARIDKYSLCPICSSVIYCTTSAAIEDNNEYFNPIYGDDRRCELPNRKILFEKIHKIDNLFHSEEIRRFQSSLLKADKFIITAKSVLEIGFGYAHELIKYLLKGANIYGIETSKEAVARFRHAHPDYADRVMLGQEMEIKVDVAYANALFEHLDEPVLFLQRISGILTEGGRLILRLPLISSTMINNEKLQYDINFWAPYHRALYSIQSISMLASKCQFELTEHAFLDYYGFRVMNRMLSSGYDDIMQVRNPYYELKGLRSELEYMKILIGGVLEKSICKDCVVFLEKR